MVNWPTLGSSQTIRVIQPGQQRVKIFVDFWNVIINVRKQTDRFELDFHWNKLADFIVGETYRGYGDESSNQIAGCYVFGSYSKSNPDEHAFINEILDRYGSFPGLFFDFRERVKKETASKCPHCGKQISRSSELGIDVLLTVEMIKHASMREHEYLALVSSDRDFLPLLSYLKDQGQRVLHVATGEAHREMRSLTWKQTKLEEAYPHLCSISHENRLVFADPQRPELTSQATSNLEKHGLQYELVDICKADDIKDKDLNFLLQNQSLYFRKRGDQTGGVFPANLIAKSLNELRGALSNGEVTATLPYVMYDGQIEAHADEYGRWIRSSGPQAFDIWANVGKQA